MSKESLADTGFITALLGKVKTGSITLVREREMRGPRAWSNDAPKYFVALYPHNPADYQWLLSHEKAVSRTGRIDPKAGFHGKCYLQNGTQEEVLKQAIGSKNEGFGADYPHAMMPNLPREVRVAISPVMPEEALGGHTRAMLLAAPFSPDMLNRLLAALGKEGLLPDKPALPLEYRLHIDMTEGNMILAVPMPEHVAASYLANPHVTVESWLDNAPFDATKMTLQILAGEASEHLKPIPRERPKEEPRVETIIEPRPQPVALSSAAKALCALKLSVQHQPQWNGGRMSRLFVPPGVSVEPFTDQRKNPNSAHVAHYIDPLRISDKKPEPDGSTSYVIAQAELERLQTITGSLNTLLELGLDESMLGRLFDRRSYTGIAANKHRQFGVLHAMFGTILPSTEGGETTYAVYLTADHKARLDELTNRLQIATNAKTLSKDTERPCLVRLDIKEGAWKLLKHAAEHAGLVEKTTFIDMGESKSLQYFDDHARDLAGVNIVKGNAEEQDATAPKKEKISGDEAIVDIARKLAERITDTPPSSKIRSVPEIKESLGQMKIAPDNLRVVKVTRQGPKGERYVTTSLIIRGKINALNHVVRYVGHKIEAPPAIRLISGHKNDGASRGILEIMADDALIAAVEAARGHKIARHEPTLDHSDYSTVLRKEFEQREEAIANDEEHRKAWEVVARADLHMIRVAAPDLQKIGANERIIAELKALYVAIEDPEQALERMKQEHGSALRQIRGKGSNELIEERLSRTLKNIRFAKETSKDMLDYIDTHLQQLRRECEVLQHKGQRFECIALQPSQELRHALKVLSDDAIQEVKATDSNALRIIPKQHTAFVRAVNNRGAAIDIKQAETVRIDTLDSWIRDLIHVLEEEKAAKAKKSDNPGAVVTSITGHATAHASAPEAAKTKPTSRRRRGHDVYEAVNTVAKETFGLVAWEAPYHEDQNAPKQAEVKPQPVLVLSTTTHEQIQHVIALFEVLKEQGWLMEHPRFYGEIRHTSKLPSLHAAPQEIDPVIDRLKTSLDVMNMLRGMIGAAINDMRAHASPDEQVGIIKERLAKYIEDRGNVANANDQRWIHSLSKALERPTIESLESANRNMGLRLRDINDELYDARTNTTRTKPKKENMHVIEVIEAGEPMLYPVDTKDGRVTAGRVPMQMDTWRRVVQGNNKGTAAVKLYINPEKLGELEEMLEKKPSIQFLASAANTESRTPDEIATRIHGLQQRYTAPSLAM